MNFPLHVSSEIGKLQQVIVHCPDNGIDRISPRRAEELLFDDIVYLRRMREEHNVFTDVLKMFLGATNVLEAEDLILEALEGNSERKQRLLHDIARFEELPEAFIDILANLPDTELKDVLITGYHAGTEQILFDPIPNFIFTRDIAVMINDHVLVTKPSKEARFRENFLTRFIFWDNPRFASLRTGDAGARIINLNKINRFPPSKGGEPVSIEGGDVMIINEKYLLIGCSERSTAHGIDLLKAELFARGVVENVVQINIPAQRSCMHIDTIFTQINHNHIVSFAPLVEEGLGSYVQVYRRDGSSKKYLTISDFFRAEINPDMQFIRSGGGISPYQEREQWTDGCNLVAIKPGVAITYDRNVETGKELEKYGYAIRDAESLLAAYRAGTLKPEGIENTIITIPSSELSRARGGSHCMTCPVSRLQL